MIYDVRTIRIWGLLILAGWLAACGMALPSTMQPVSTPTVLEEPTPDAAEVTFEEEWLTFDDESRTLSFQYPPSWTVLAPAAVDLDDLLAGAESSLGEPVSSTLIGLHEILAQPEKWSAVGFLVENAEADYIPNFTVSVVNANPLPLDLYLNLTTKQLAAMDGITVEESAFVGNLRPGGMAIPSLRYTMKGALSQSDLVLEGWQVAFYNEAGTHIFLFTFTATEDQFTDLEPIFTRMIGSARVGNSWGISGDLPLMMPIAASLTDQCVPKRWWTLPLTGVDLTVHVPPDWSLADMTNPAVLSSTISSLVAGGADAKMIEDVRNGAQVAILHGELRDDADLPDFATQMVIFFIAEAKLPPISYAELFGIVSEGVELARITALDHLRGDASVQIRHYEMGGAAYAPTLLDVNLEEIRYAFSDAQREKAVVVAFLTTEKRFEELQPIFEQIVACLSFDMRD
ncbi:MAG: hypothetical protein KF893_06510 [Caldilineaceae bacterium]|nr:hypothetical protein [Caldilineaceae bacterium]